MSQGHEAFLLHSEIQWRLQESTCVTDMQAKIASFFMELNFYWNEYRRKKWWLFRLGYLADILMKMNKVRLSPQGK